jgi:hypothetical protein
MPASDLFTVNLAGKCCQWLVSVLFSLCIAMLALFGVALAHVLYIFTRRRIVAYRSPLQNLPGPKNAHWFKGNFVDLREADSSRLQEEWVRTYGHVLKYHSGLAVRRPFRGSVVVVFLLDRSHNDFFALGLTRYGSQSPKLLAVDPVAVSYILQNDGTFQKSEILRFLLGEITGRGMYDRAFLRLRFDIH